MSDLISRQAAIDALHMHLMYRMGTDSNKKRLDEWINNLPSVQPEIIRCKDCTNWDTTWTNDWTQNYHYGPIIDGVRKDEFYCADAERRTDDRETS